MLVGQFELLNFGLNLLKFRVFVNLYSWLMLSAPVVGGVW